jgi:hypothetical protein
MSRPEASDNISEYAPRGSSEFYRHGRAGAALGEGSTPKGDLSRLRQALGPEPEVVHVPQPGRRLGWFAAGFAIALTFGIGIGWLVIAGLPAITGKSPASSTQTAENSKPPQEASASAVAVPAAPVAPRVAQPSAPSAAAPAAATSPQLASAPPPSAPAPTVRGVTDTEIRFGISAPFSGPAKELGQNMKLGIEAAFNVANANGGVFGRKLRLIAADDGYEPSRTTGTMAQLYEKDQVFGLIGNVGTPTAVVALPYALDRKMLFFGAFTGADLLRSDPPDRYVFNYRSSYVTATPDLPVWKKLFVHCGAAMILRLCGSVTSATQWTWKTPSHNCNKSSNKGLSSQ